MQNSQGRQELYSRAAPTPCKLESLPFRINQSCQGHSGFASMKSPLGFVASLLPPGPTLSLLFLRVEGLPEKSIRNSGFSPSTRLRILSGKV